MQVLGGVPFIFVDNVDDVASKLAAAFYGGPSLEMRMIGIAGTSGKTTVSWLVRGVLEELGQLTGLVGSIEYALAEDRLDEDGALWEPEVEDPTAERECTSPFHLAPFQGKYSIDYTHDMDGVKIQKLLSGMRDRGATVGVLEASTEALSRGWLEYVDIDVGVWTCFEEDPRHVALHGSVEAYLDSKLKMFEALQNADQQRAVVNIDDPTAKRVLEAVGVPTVTYSIRDRRADVWAESIQLTAWETEVIVRVPGGRRLQIISSLVGRHNVYNILAAVAVGVVLDAPLEAVVAGIEAVTVIPGRSEVVNSDPEDPVLRGDFPVMIDAADTPARVATLLESVREASGGGRVFTVLGCDGETTDKAMRTQIGAAAFARSDVVIVTNTSPRRELPHEIIADIMDGLPDKVLQAYTTYVYSPFQDQGHVPLWFEPWLHSAQRRHNRHVIEDRFSAIRAAIGTAQPSDTVVLLGQGHRDWAEHWDGNEDEPGLKRGWFDDRVEARNALSKLEYLYSLVDLDRRELPWSTGSDADRSTIWEEPLLDGGGGAGGAGSEAGGGARR
ncbi:MAG: Mur ligase [Monoraphidium minutum]|nr:MAG: Mur ligase [Monoraphidium minutum]